MDWVALLQKKFRSSESASGAKIFSQAEHGRKAKRKTPLIS